MVNSIEKFLKEKYGINEKVVAAVNKAEEEIKEYTEKLDEIREYNQYKVISAMQNFLPRIIRFSLVYWIWLWRSR